MNRITIRTLYKNKLMHCRRLGYQYGNWNKRLVCKDTTLTKGNWTKLCRKKNVGAMLFNTIRHHYKETKKITSPELINENISYGFLVLRILNHFVYKVYHN